MQVPEKAINPRKHPASSILKRMVPALVVGEVGCALQHLDVIRLIIAFPMMVNAVYMIRSYGRVSPWANCCVTILVLNVLSSDDRYQASNQNTPANFIPLLL